MKNSLVNYSSEDDQNTTSDENSAQHHRNTRRPTETYGKKSSFGKSCNGSERNTARSHSKMSPPGKSRRLRARSPSMRGEAKNSSASPDKFYNDRAADRGYKYVADARKLDDRMTTKYRFDKNCRYNKERDRDHISTYSSSTFRYEDEQRRQSSKMHTRHYDSEKHHHRSRSPHDRKHRRHRSPTHSNDSVESAIEHTRHSSHKKHSRSSLSHHSSKPRERHKASDDRSKSDRSHKKKRSYSRSISPSHSYGERSRYSATKDKGRFERERSTSKDSLARATHKRDRKHRSRTQTPVRSYDQKVAKPQPEITNGKDCETNSNSTVIQRRSATICSTQNATATAVVPESSPTVRLVTISDVNPVIIKSSLSAPTTLVVTNTAVTAPTAQLPTYYNPNVVKANRYVEQAQKRKLLWGSKKADDSCKKWGNAQFSQDGDGKMATKFMRLMGMKAQGAANSPVPEGEEDKKSEVNSRQRMFSSMEHQYEVARAVTHTMRGVGLGFGSQIP